MLLLEKLGIQKGVLDPVPFISVWDVSANRNWDDAVGLVDDS